MRFKAKNTVSAIIQHSSDLSKLKRKLDELVYLTNIVQKNIQQLTQISLEAGLLAPHIFVGGYTAGCLTLTLDSPLWAHELRFLVTDLQKALKKHPKFQTLSQIQIQVLEGLHETVADCGLQKPVLSKQNAHELENLANALPDHRIPLKRILNMLAKHGA